MGKIVYKSLNQEDLQETLQLVQEDMDLYACGLKERLYMEGEKVASRWAKGMEVGALAKVDHEIVGVMTAILSPAASEWTVIVLYVKKLFRLQGIGSGLLDYLEASIHALEKSQNVYVSLNIQEKMAYGFFHKRGYEPESYLITQNHHQNQVVMVHHLKADQEVEDVS